MSKKQVTKSLLDDLSIRHNAFVADFIVHGDQQRAYRAAFDCSTMTDKAVSVSANRLCNLPAVAEKIAAHKKTVTKAALITAVEVMQEYIDIVTADATKLVQVRHRNCRYCHGVDFNFQWIDENEYCNDVIAAQQWNANRSAKAPPKEMPLDNGGYGFNGNLQPHDDCPRCWGDGVTHVWIADTRDLTGKEKKLFAGVKQTPNGIQILMRDQDAGLKNLAQLMGMFIERVQIGGDGGEPIATLQLPNDPEEASKVYKAFITSRKASN